MARGGLTEAAVIARMVDIVRLLRRSIARGIAGTRYDDRVLGHQSGKFNDLMKTGRLRCATRTTTVRWAAGGLPLPVSIVLTFTFCCQNSPRRVWKQG